MAGKDNCTTAAHGGTLFGSETANAANIPAKRGHVREQLAFSLLMTAKWCANNILKKRTEKRF